MSEIVARQRGVGLPQPHMRIEQRYLRFAATFFAIAVLIHNSDHLRRGGDSLTAEVFWLGTLAIVVEVGVVALVFIRHPFAPLAAAAAGFSLALGYIAVHFMPEWSSFSDSFTSDQASWMSWFAASLETTGALLLGSAGVYALRRSGRSATGAIDSPDQLPFSDALRQPVVVALLLGNVIIFIGSLATR